MTRALGNLLITIACLCTYLPASYAQDNTDAVRDESSEQVDESEEAYRRRMELEGARDRDTYIDNTYTPPADQEKIDKLPAASQKNIRDQITDIIIENGQWEPSDVLTEYPYEPTADAQKDSELLEQEQEAWAEQVDKYHEREAAAFGATRPPMPGSDPMQAGAGSGGSGQQDGSQGGSGGTGAQQGGQAGDGSSGPPGSYEPYQAPDRDRDEEVSTAGVSESALDFLRGRQGSGGSGPEPAQASPELASEPDQAEPSGETQPSEPPAEVQNEASDERLPDGSLPIGELDHLQGVIAEGNADQAPPAAPTRAPVDGPEPAQAEPDSATEEQTAESAQQQVSKETKKHSTPDLDLRSPGIIAIKELEKLEGLEDAEVDSDPRIDQPDVSDSD